MTSNELIKAGGYIILSCFILIILISMTPLKGLFSKNGLTISALLLVIIGIIGIILLFTGLVKNDKKQK